MSFSAPRVKQQCPKNLYFSQGQATISQYLIFSPRVKQRSQYLFIPSRVKYKAVGMFQWAGYLLQSWPHYNWYDQFILGCPLGTKQVMLGYSNHPAGSSTRNLECPNNLATSPRSWLPNLAWQVDYIMIPYIGLPDISIIQAFWVIKVWWFHYYITLD